MFPGLCSLQCSLWSICMSHKALGLYLLASPTQHNPSNLYSFSCRCGFVCSACVIKSEAFCIGHLALSTFPEFIQAAGPAGTPLMLWPTIQYQSVDMRFQVHPLLSDGYLASAFVATLKNDAIGE